MTYDAGPVSVRGSSIILTLPMRNFPDYIWGKEGTFVHLLHESFNLILVQNKSTFDTFGFDFFGGSFYLEVLKFNPVSGRSK